MTPAQAQNIQALQNLLGQTTSFADPSQITNTPTASSTISYDTNAVQKAIAEAYQTAMQSPNG